MDIASDINLVGGLLGGLMIGLSSALLLLGSGRIAGISGIFGQAGWRGEGQWRLWFVVGLLAGAGVWLLVTGELAVELQTGMPGMLAAAALVGVGTRLGSGCTSGHGICGLGRRSGRSLMATCVFMATAIITVAVIRGLT